MHHMKFVLNIRLVALLAVTIAVLLAASAFSPPRQASAASDFEFEGVICLETTQGDFDQATMILIRFDPVKGQPGTWGLSQVSYEGDTDGNGAADTNVGSPCNPATDTNTFNIPFEYFDTTNRPSSTATINGAGTEISWAGDCTFRDDIDRWVLATFVIDVTGEKSFTDNASKNDGTLDFDLFVPAQECTGAPANTGALIARTVVRDSTGGGTSDWDNDGNSDWDELGKKSQFAGNGCDPFNPNDNVPVPALCTVGSSSVGGIAELAAEAGTPLAAPDSSGSNTGLIAGIVAAIAAGTVALGGAAWYTKRRSIQ